MKKHLLAALLLCLLLAACGKPETPPATVTAAATESRETAARTAAATESPGAALAGVWVNAGQYSEGRDFVETLSLNRDGTASVHLEYQGRDYATLEGTWTADGDTLAVDFTDPNTRDRSYTYVLTDRTLTLTGDGKDVEYVRE